MTRDSIPRDDLYGELEVSRQASVAAIEAAYRRLVKQHHPDVARSDDIERIKRLNLAREWLTDLDRRRRYDVSRGMSPTSSIAHHSPNGKDTAPGARRRPGPATTGAAPDGSSEPVRSFGVNANEVRIFLASLRGLDSERARRVFDGRAVAHAKGYAAARRAAAQVGQSKRKTEWQLAREAASVIARGKLGDTTLTEQVVDVLADTAGAIAIRDLLTRSDYRTLLVPWTWRSARVAPAAAANPPAQSTIEGPRQPSARPAPAAVLAAAPTTTSLATETPPPGAVDPRARQPTGRVSISDLGASPWQPRREPTTPPRGTGAANALPLARASAPTNAIPRPLVPPWSPPEVRIRRWLPGLVAFAVASLVTAAALGVFGPPPEQGVAALTDAPTAPTGFVVVPGQSIHEGTVEPTASDGAVEPTQPARTKRPGGGGPGPGATDPPDPTKPGATPRPTQEPTPIPAPTPTPGPTPTPSQTPIPTPTETACQVIDLVGVQTSNAQELWAAAGFTGTITFNPSIPPQYRIAWQSRQAGASVPCTSGMTVRKVAP